MGKTLKILFVVLIVADFLSMYYHLFQRFFWLDMALHFLGGIWVAILFASVFNENNLKTANFFLWAVLMISFVALVGLLWELSEFTFLNDLMARIFGSQEGVMLLDDTLSDLIFDLLGAAAAALAYWISKKKSLPFFNR